jgi:predicted nuclease of predicted toxin-antitoxin system
VRLLLDANLSPRVAELLNARGFDAVHVRERGMQHARDPQILARAADEDRVLISEDTDFGALLASSEAALPSLVLLRSGEPLTPDDHARLLGEGLPGSRRNSPRERSSSLNLHACVSGPYRSRANRSHERRSRRVKRQPMDIIGRDAHARPRGVGGPGARQRNTRRDSPGSALPGRLNS